MDIRELASGCEGDVRARHRLARQGKGGAGAAETRRDDTRLTCVSMRGWLRTAGRRFTSIARLLGSAACQWENSGARHRLKEMRAGTS